MGYSSTFDLSMLMLAIGSSLLFIFAFILIKRVRGDVKKERESQRRVDELSHAYEETVALGRRDVLLTQLLNKRIFEEDRVQLAKQAMHNVAYMSMDIQGFKAVNDRISHEAGDKGLHRYEELLVRVASDEALQQGISDCRTYRTGGELLPRTALG